MTLFVDMDEVIADTYGAHVVWYNRDFNASLSLEECHGKEVWQMVPEVHQQSVRLHATRPGFFRTLEPIVNSQEVLRELSDKYDVFIASAAMQYPNSLREKSEWLDEHFPFIHWKNRILCGEKHILKGDVLIDDRSYNLQRFTGERPMLFTSPHNVHTNGFERALDWEDIAAKFL